MSGTGTTSLTVKDIRDTPIEELRARGVSEEVLDDIISARADDAEEQKHRPTPPPCPAWCVYEAGHQYDSTVTADPFTFTRFHSTTAGADVGITVEEHNKNGVVSFASPPFVDIWIGGNQADENGASADQARDYARQLLAAADDLERIQDDLDRMPSRVEL